MHIDDAFNSSARTTIERLHRFNFISDGSAADAIEVLDETEGTDGATIGYELEITSSSVSETKFASDTPEEIYRKAQELIESLAMNYSPDENYEVSTPPVSHPAALKPITRGLITAGLIPETARGLVTEHVSIGTVETGSDDAQTTLALLGIARAVEQLGGSSYDRLMQPSQRANEEDGSPIDYAWSVLRGPGGVRWSKYPRATTEWVDYGGSRIEYRSLQFRNPTQQQITLDALYYLTRASLDTAHEAHDVYEQFDVAVSDWQTRHRLPRIWPASEYRPALHAKLSHDDMAEDWRRLSIEGFERYMLPYADQFFQPDRPFRQAVRRSILDIRDAYGLQHIATPVEQSLQD